MFPVRLTVTHLSGVGEDSIFMGVIEVSGRDHPHHDDATGSAVRAGVKLGLCNFQSGNCSLSLCSPLVLQAVQPERGTAMAWVLSSGHVASVDTSFTDWFGHK